MGRYILGTPNGIYAIFRIWLLQGSHIWESILEVILEVIFGRHIWESHCCSEVILGVIFGSHIRSRIAAAKLYLEVILGATF